MKYRGSAEEKRVEGQRSKNRRSERAGNKQVRDSFFKHDLRSLVLSIAYIVIMKSYTDPHRHAIPQKILHFLFTGSNPLMLMNAWIITIC